MKYTNKAIPLLVKAMKIRELLHNEAFRGGMCEPYKVLAKVQFLEIDLNREINTNFRWGRRIWWGGLV